MIVASFINFYETSIADSSNCACHIANGLRITIAGEHLRLGAWRELKQSPPDDNGDGNTGRSTEARQHGKRLDMAGVGMPVRLRVIDPERLPSASPSCA